MVRPLIALLAVVPLALAGGAWGQQPVPTVGVTTLVIKGHGWGHGIGMGQWGALGMARKGFTYSQILAHYYPGTSLGKAPATSVRVLLATGKKVTVASPAELSVQDAAGTVTKLPAGSYTLGSDLTLRPDPTKPKVALQPPVTFMPGKSPLVLGKVSYRGRIEVQPVGKKLQAVNVVGLDSYVQGVVTLEMPKTWPPAALEAQAVAARSYALATRALGHILYPDTRSQVYGGLDGESPAGVAAVAATRGQVLLYAGAVATTYYYSSSGGRTAAYSDVFPARPPIPYLVSVADPYDAISPYHNWGPILFTAAQVSSRLHVPDLVDLVPDLASQRPRQLIATGSDGQVTLLPGAVRAALGLRSSWISTGLLSLTRPDGRLTAGSAVTLSGSIKRVSGPVSLEQHVAGGPWEPGPGLSRASDGSFSVQVRPTLTTQYRLSLGPQHTKAVTVAIAPAGS